MSVMRYKLLIEYDGTNYAGWQRQDDIPTVQSEIENAIKGFCGQDVHVQCAGRTDSGVHAWGQVAHVDLEPLKQPMSPYEIAKAINAHLWPQPISILNVEEVDAHFHARYAAKTKQYSYHLVYRPAALTLDRNRAWHLRKPLNVDAMREAAAHLIGHHDFSTFRDSECQSKSPEKTLEVLDITENTYGIDGTGKRYILTCQAQSFLHHMVRNITGTLKLVGAGKWAPDEVKTALEAKDRTKGGPTAPPEGLYLDWISYE